MNYFCEPLGSDDQATRTEHITALIETLTEPAYLWNVAAQLSREVDRIDPRRVQDDFSDDAKATLIAAQAHLDKACELLSRLSYRRPIRSHQKTGARR